MYSDSIVDWSSVNGSYMNTGSKYSSHITPVPNEDIYYENREIDDYPPIGQLIPIGYSLEPLIIFCILYALLHPKKN